MSEPREKRPADLQPGELWAVVRDTGGDVGWFGRLVGFPDLRDAAMNAADVWTEGRKLDPAGETVFVTIEKPSGIRRRFRCTVKFTPRIEVVSADRKQEPKTGDAA